MHTRYHCHRCCQYCYSCTPLNAVTVPVSYVLVAHHKYQCHCCCQYCYSCTPVNAVTIPVSYVLVAHYRYHCHCCFQYCHSCKLLTAVTVSTMIVAHQFTPDIIADRLLAVGGFVSELVFTWSILRIWWCITSFVCIFIRYQFIRYWEVSCYLISTKLTLSSQK
jgi:hypothetical protein